MLESYIKLNQDLNRKNLKLKEIDERINELDRLRNHMSNLKDNVNFNLAPSVGVSNYNRIQPINSDLSQIIVDETNESVAAAQSNSRIPKEAQKLLSELNISSKVCHSTRCFCFL